MEKESHSGIYLLPNLFTTVSLFSAFYSIVASMKGLYDTAVIAIFIGMIADGLDGRVARLTNTQSTFGAEYDSLSDMVTFGVAPALLAYSASLQHLGKIGWLVAFIWTASVALRLARFNTQLEVADKRYFQGLPCPPAAAVLSSFIWLRHQHHWQGAAINIFVALLCVIIAILMVSNVRYHSFKEIDFKGKVPFLHILFMVILFAMVALNPAWMLFLGFSAYLLSGWVLMIVLLWKLRGNVKSS